jgi:hypothetical protein
MRISKNKTVNSPSITALAGFKIRSRTTASFTAEQGEI